ncbi:uncharacterized protein LOC124970266 [Sciurus carolinensis]|uniref:uncharacterized protein LOC124970266 n=1 Tax=Sciurus carolinensis TaxID=30640 RepID=UPI001FB4C887|nr:uncharacterized protein LOC124970266 [Sciurus carolinensis]
MEVGDGRRLLLGGLPSLLPTQHVCLRIAPSPIWPVAALEPQLSSPSGWLCSWHPRSTVSAWERGQGPSRCKWKNTGSWAVERRVPGNTPCCTQTTGRQRCQTIKLTHHTDQGVQVENVPKPKNSASGQDLQPTRNVPGARQSLNHLTCTRKRLFRRLKLNQHTPPRPAISLEIECVKKISSPAAWANYLAEHLDGSMPLNHHGQTSTFRATQGREHEACLGSEGDSEAALNHTHQAASAFSAVERVQP